MKRCRPAAFILVLVMLLPVLLPRPARAFKVFVSVLPQKYFAERIGGDRVDCSVMVGPGQSPATYEPTPKQMASLGEAKIYFTIGVPFEKAWIDRVSAANAGMTIVDTSAGVTGRTFSGEGEKPRAIPDPHIWASPLLAGPIARTMTTALVEADPGHRAAYESRYRRLAADLIDLDLEIRALLRTTTRRAFMVFHPAWGYFADTYGLLQISVEEGGIEPGGKSLALLIERAREEGIDTLFVQKQFSRRNAETVAAAIGAVVVPLDPLSPDYMENLRATAAAIAEALR